MELSISVVELNSIAHGIETADTMLKAGRVELAFAKPVCPGKFIVMIHGDIGAVNAAVAAGRVTGGGSIINHVIILRVHPGLLPALNGTTEVPNLSALGVVEYFDITSAVLGADSVAKASQVSLIEVRLGMGIGGKSFFKICGQVSDVQSALNVAQGQAQERGTIVASCIIPSPSPALFRQML